MPRSRTSSTSSDNSMPPLTPGSIDSDSSSGTIAGFEGGIKNGLVVERNDVLSCAGVAGGTVGEEDEDLALTSMREALGLEELCIEGRYLDDIALRALELTYGSKRTDTGELELEDKLVEQDAIPAEQESGTIDDWIVVKELKEGDITDGTGVYGYGARLDVGDFDGLVIRSVAPTPSHRVQEEKYDFVDLDQVSLVEQGGDASTEQGGDIGSGEAQEL